MDIHASGASLTITEINGQPVVAGSSVTLAGGEVVTLNPDGTMSIEGQDDVDADEETTFTYTVEDDLGNTDTGVVEVTTTPCFVAGTLIDTPTGLVAIEHLEPGDLVLTRDSGGPAPCAGSAAHCGAPRPPKPRCDLRRVLWAITQSWSCLPVTGY